MSYIPEVNGAITQLNCAIRRLNNTNDHHAIGLIHNARGTLQNVVSNMNTLYGKYSVAESSRDALLLAIAGTNEGRDLDITEPDKVISEAMTIIRTMDADIRTSREADEIPFGAVEQDHDKMQLEQRVAELELQLELKVDEHAATEKSLRAVRDCWHSLLELINRLDPGSVNLGSIPSALLNTETTIFRRHYYHDGAHVGGIIYTTDSNLTDEMKSDIANKIEKSKGGGGFKNMFVDKKVDNDCECKRQESASHELKILPEFFNAVISGNKKAEIRKADRLFSAGDELWLREWTVQDGYTGRDVCRVVTHVTDLMGYAPGYVMLSIEPEIKGGSCQ